MLIMQYGRQGLSGVTYKVNTLAAHDLAAVNVASQMM